MCSFAAEPKCPAVWQGGLLKALASFGSQACASQSDEVIFVHGCLKLNCSTAWVHELNSFCYDFSHSGNSKCWFWSAGTSPLFPNSALDIVITILYASREKFNPHYLRGQEGCCCHSVPSWAFGDEITSDVAQCLTVQELSQPGCTWIKYQTDFCRGKGGRGKCKALASPGMPSLCPAPCQKLKVRSNGRLSARSHLARTCTNEQVGWNSALWWKHKRSCAAETSKCSSSFCSPQQSQLGLCCC